MIKLIHGADFHLDSPFSGLAPDQAAQRRREQRELLARLAQLAREREADLVLLSGDLLDGRQTYRETAQALMDSATADRCLEILAEKQLREPVLASLLSAIQRHLDRRAGEDLQTGAVLFSNQYGLLGMTRGAKEILDTWNTAKN